MDSLPRSHTTSTDRSDSPTDAESPERRRFLTRISIALSAAMGAVIVKPEETRAIVAFLIAPR